MTNRARHLCSRTQRVCISEHKVSPAHRPIDLTLIAVASCGASSEVVWCASSSTSIGTLTVPSYKDLICAPWAPSCTRRRTDTFQFEPQMDANCSRSINTNSPNIGIPAKQCKGDTIIELMPCLLWWGCMLQACTIVHALKRTAQHSSTCVYLEVAWVL